MSMVMNPPPELIGRSFGRRRVIARGRSRNGRAYWVCECRCGELSEVRTDDLINGKAKTCGCWKLRHGEAMNGGTREYRAWRDAKKRCSNHTDPGFRNYGGRG